jgi:DNA-binding beta-propeller fold protein YncE
VPTPRGLWVATYDGHVLALIDPVTAAIVRRVAFGGTGGGVAYAAGSLWVSDYGYGRVVRLDPATGKTLKSLRVGVEPRDLVLAAGRLWVVEQGSSDVRAVPFR